MHMVFEEHADGEHTTHYTVTIECAPVRRPTRFWKTVQNAMDEGRNVVVRVNRPRGVVLFRQACKVAVLNSKRGFVQFACVQTSYAQAA